MAEKKTVCVVGSINMDLTVKTDKVPEQGETVLGQDFAAYPGGKGANQAVAAARSGAQVHMIGAVGDDSFGKTLLSHLEKEGIHTDGILQSPESASGIASIILSDNDNRIIVAPGANNLVTKEWIEQHKNLISQSDIILLQLEIPLESVRYTIEIANRFHVPVILNPAPFQPLSDELLQGVTYITPNELEARALTDNSASALFQDKLIVTRGDQGVSFFTGGKHLSFQGFDVDAIDTTGAGDTFNGVLASQLASGKSLEKSVEYANAAGALSVTKVGAQSGMPAIMEIEEFLKNHPHR
ncbi:ribokinase [Oceanobacillus damuensis]|uniref:ribokinase n=1 Tax=Oceanobacillus damuensis TaxID=937928 RepID=UPI00082D804D|nr:ribokinase [Oceanobacillus damuensis]